MTVEVLRRGAGAPAVRLGWATPEARERAASSNLVLLVHVMRAATHPLEQYELFKKIALFAEYCERAGSCRDRAVLRAGPLYAVVHADIAGAPVPAASPGTSIAPLWTVHTDTHGGDACRVVSPPAPSRAPSPGRRAWDRPGMAISAAVILWAGLVLGAYVVTHNNGPSGLRAPVPPIPAAIHIVPVPPRDRAAVSQRAPSGGPQRPASSVVTVAIRVAPRAPAGSDDIERPSGSAAQLEDLAEALPRFRVVSGVLARDVAELRSKTLFEQGVDAFVRATADNLAQIQYGAYRSKEFAEEDARRIRAQGYTAVVVRW